MIKNYEKTGKSLMEFVALQPHQVFPSDVHIFSFDLDAFDEFCGDKLLFIKGCP